MAKILLAASLEPREILIRILDGHDVVCADTVEAALELLREHAIDLIICTIVFDDSRMFDLLRLAKASRASQRIPFVCSRIRPYIIKSQAAIEAAKLTSRTLGAEAFVDLADFKTDPEREMREAIDRILTGETTHLA
jgi:CheY-like chemotaxis protein